MQLDQSNPEKRVQIHLNPKSTLGTVSLNLDPATDTYVDSQSPTTNFYTSNLMKAKSYVEGWKAGSLIKFNLSAIPAGSTINSANLKLYQYACWGEPQNPHWITVSKVDADWAENTVTWNTKPANGSITRNSSAAADCPATPTYNKGYSTFDITYVVQNLVNTPPNYGFFVHNQASSTTYWKMYYQKDQVTPSYTPKLEITYTPPAAPPAPAGDTTAPTITDVKSSNLGKTSAAITWTTNEDSSSFVDYGKTTSYGSSAGQADTTKNHEASLSSLENKTTYHFRSRSKDAAGNEAVSGDYTFTTLASSESSSVEEDTMASDLENESTLTSTTSGKKSSNPTEKDKSSSLILFLLAGFSLAVAILIGGVVFYLRLRKKKIQKVEVGKTQEDVSTQPETQEPKPSI